MIPRPNERSWAKWEDRYVPVGRWVSSLASFLLLCFFCCWFGFLLVDFLVVVVANEFGMKASNKKRVFEYIGTKRVIIKTRYP